MHRNLIENYKNNFVSWEQGQEIFKLIEDLQDMLIELINATCV